MLQLTSTEHLTGIRIQGDYNDLSELVESIHRITTLDDPNDFSDPYYGVLNRLLGICYDLRHAYMGDRDITLFDNNNAQGITLHGRKISDKNLYYSVEIFFSDALFAALSVPDAYESAKRFYKTKKSPKQNDQLLFSYADYLRDTANLNVFFAGIWQVVENVIGTEAFLDLMHLKETSGTDYRHYVSHYIDECNLQLLRTDVSKRSKKILETAKNLITKPDSYQKLEKELEYWAKEYMTSIYRLEVPEHEYPDHFEW